MIVITKAIGYAILERIHDIRNPKCIPKGKGNHRLKYTKNYVDPLHEKRKSLTNSFDST